jgi:hypothetical protein
LALVSGPEVSIRSEPVTTPRFFVVLMIAWTRSCAFPLRSASPAPVPE